MIACPEVLRCPHTGEALQVLKSLPGMSQKEPEFLCNTSRSFAYPVIEDIAMLLKENAVPLHENGIMVESISESDKTKVRDFYNAVGWTANEQGEYADAVIYEDLRAVSSEYIRRCHERVSRHLPASGKFLLDAASGAIQFTDLLEYSKNFEYRICADFSLSALREAKKKLGPKGIYLLCDITNLPLRDNFTDAFISLNTIYHIPKDQQAKAVRELYRTLKPSARGILVYDWFKHSAWMNVALLPFRAFVFLRNRLFKTKGEGGRLYFFAHSLSWFRKNLPPFQLAVWRSVSVPFLKYYIHENFFGRSILRKIFHYEEKYPERCGRLGEYPMMIFTRDISR